MEKNIIFFIAVFLLSVSITICLILCSKKKKVKQLIWVSALGGIIGILVSLLFNQSLISTITSVLFATVFVQLFWLLCEVTELTFKEEISEFYDDGCPPRYYITGDKHRNFSRVSQFCKEMKTRKKDVLIVLGDSGFNYFNDERDDKLKSEAAKLNITLFCLHGNKEDRPQNIASYGVRTFCGGKVYYEPRYPNIFFAIDGETYRFNGKEYLVVGGAHSVDKYKCIEKGLPFFEDEMPNEQTKMRVEHRLSERDYQIYGMLTHTCPIQYIPKEMFLTTRENAQRKKPTLFPKKKFKPDIDRSTEEWLSKIESKLDYTRWFCGHYHIDKQIDKITMMNSKIRPLYDEEFDIA